MVAMRNAMRRLNHAPEKMRVAMKRMKKGKVRKRFWTRMPVG